MKKIIFYALLLLFEVLILIIPYLFLNWILLNFVFVCFLYFNLILKFILFYFMPIYFILHLYTVNYLNYYDLNFTNTKLYIFLLDIKECVLNFFYYYRYLFIYLFSLFFFISFNYNKFFFIIVVFFIFFFKALNYLYKNMNILKIFIEKNFIFLNISFILVIVYLFKYQNYNESEFNNLFNLEDKENFSEFIYEVSYPRWLFKSSFPKLFPEYKNEIKLLNRRLMLHDLLVKDQYLSNFKNINYNYSYIIIKKMLTNNMAFYGKIINKNNLLYFKLFKQIYVFDKFVSINSSNRLNDYKIFDKKAFNNSNKVYNIIFLNSPKNNSVLFEDKTLFTSTFFKELRLSQNLLVNANIVYSKHIKNMNNLLVNSFLLNKINKKINSYLYFNNNNSKILTLYNNKSNNNKYSDYFCRLKLSTLSYTDLLNFNNYKKNNIISNLNLFFKQIFKNNVNNQYDIYISSYMFNYDFFVNSSLSYNDYLEKTYRDFDLELFITSLYKYYKYFNNDINIINWFSDFFIILFDTQKLIYNYQSNIESFNEIKVKDSFNLYKNFMGGINNVYKGDSSFFSYNDYKRTGVHYEDIFLSENIKKDVWDSLNFKSFFFRFFNYSKSMEQFCNSYLWLSLDDSNIDLERSNLLLKYNKYLLDHKYLLVKSKSKFNDKLKELNLNIKKFKKISANKKLYDSIMHKHKPMRIIRFVKPITAVDTYTTFKNAVAKSKMEAAEKARALIEKPLQKSDILRLKKIVNMDNFLKRKILNKSILLNYFIKKNHTYDFFFNYKVVNVKKFLKYIFFEKYIDNGFNNKSKIFYIFDIKNYRYKYLNFKILEKYKK